MAKIIDFFDGFTKFFTRKLESKSNDSKKPEARGTYYGNSIYSNVFGITFDGEKSFGEIGPIKDYNPDHAALRYRSWQSFLESDIVQMVMTKYIKWIVGYGLRPQSEPQQVVLEANGIKLNKREFSKFVEARFNLWAKSKNSDYQNRHSFQKLQKIALKEAKYSGDVLVVLRLVSGNVKIELIDGARLGGSIKSSYPIRMDNGNWLWHGVEMNDRWEQLAYHVDQEHGEKSVIKAKNNQGLTQAFLYYGFEYRMHNVRGIPLTSVVLQQLKVLDRYKEATLASAEEQAKIIHTLEHGMHSSGENAFLDNLVASQPSISNDATVMVDPEDVTKKVMTSTNRTAINLPIDSTLKMHANQKEIHFNDFFEPNIDLVAGALNMPPDVAKSKYNSNFSASRAAGKDWEHTISVERFDFTDQFLQNVYNFWLHVMILQNKIDAPGYLLAKEGSEIREAYRNVRFIGPGFPHIDPEKEVRAERLKLGSTAEHIPLTTLEKSVENLNEGDYSQNLDGFVAQMQEAVEKNLKTPSIENEKSNDSDDD